MNDDQIKKLLSLKRDINSLFFKHRETLHEMREMSANNQHVDPEIVISLAKRIALTTRAPPLWKPGYPLDMSFGHAPCPQLEELAGGYLRQHQIQHGSRKREQITASKIMTDSSIENMDTSIPSSSVKIADVMSHLGLTLSSETAQDVRMEIEPTKQRPVANKTNEEPQVKKARHINLSFGLSDSEDEDE
jgi:hypothetical protein